MKYNKFLKEQINETFNNQLRNNDPPETKITYQRLLKEGILEQRAKELIGIVLSAEIYDVLKEKKPFNEKRYVGRLARLPDTSFLDEGSGE